MAEDNIIGGNENLDSKVPADNLGGGGIEDVNVDTGGLDTSGPVDTGGLDTSGPVDTGGLDTSGTSKGLDTSGPSGGLDTSGPTGPSTALVPVGAELIVNGNAMAGSSQSLTGVINAPNGYYWTSFPVITTPSYVSGVNLALGSGQYPSQLNIDFTVNPWPSIEDDVIFGMDSTALVSQIPISTVNYVIKDYITNASFDNYTSVFLGAQIYDLGTSPTGAGTLITDSTITANTGSTRYIRVRIETEYIWGYDTASAAGTTLTFVAGNTGTNHLTKHSANLVLGGGLDFIIEDNNFGVGNPGGSSTITYRIDGEPALNGSVVLKKDGGVYPLNPSATNNSYGEVMNGTSGNIYWRPYISANHNDPFNPASAELSWEIDGSPIANALWFSIPANTNYNAVTVGSTQVITQPSGTSLYFSLTEDYSSGSFTTKSYGLRYSETTPNFTYIQGQNPIVSN